MSMLPVAGTPRFNILVNADTAREYGTSDGLVMIAISFINTPVGWTFRMWDLKTTGWSMIADEDDTTSAGSYAYGGDLNQMIADMKAMGGPERFIELRVAPWIAEKLKRHFAGKIIGVVTAPDNVPSEITPLNIAIAMNAALMRFQFMDKADADGIPELHRVS
jgi:hypothetical protein